MKNSLIVNRVEREYFPIKKIRTNTTKNQS